MAEALLMRRGGGLSMPKLALATANAENVELGYSFYGGNTKELRSGSMVKYHYQTIVQKVTKETTLTFTATGSTLLVAVGTLCSSQYTLENEGADPIVIFNNECYTDRIGGNINSRYSVSGNTITVTIDDADVDSYGDPTYLHLFILSK